MTTLTVSGVTQVQAMMAWLNDQKFEHEVKLNFHNPFGQQYTVEFASADEAFLTRLRWGL